MSPRYVSPSVISYTEAELRSNIEAFGASPTANGSSSNSGAGSSNSGSDSSS